MMKDNLPSTRKPKSVRPLTNPDEIDCVRSHLQSRHRDLLLFELAIQTGLRLQDLLQLKVSDLNGLETGQRIDLPNVSAAPPGGPVMTALLQETFQHYINEIRAIQDQFLFKSQKNDRPLTLSSASHLISIWYQQTGLTGLRGARSLHKTWEALFRQPASTEFSTDTGLHEGGLLGPVNPPTLAKSVYEEIVNSIVAGRIRPGQRLVAREIAEQAEVSYMPAREALGWLQAAGFITIKRKKGYVVNTLSRSDLKEVSEIRLSLETATVRKAVLARSDKTIVRLEKLLALYLVAIGENNAIDAFCVGREFHRTLYQDANMPIYTSIIETLWDKLSPYYYIEMKERKGNDAAWFAVQKRLHEKILQGMREKDPDKVDYYLRQDINATNDIVTGIFDSTHKP